MYAGVKESVSVIPSLNNTNTYLTTPGVNQIPSLEVLDSIGIGFGRIQGEMY